MRYLLNQPKFSSNILSQNYSNLLKLFLWANFVKHASTTTFNSLPLQKQGVLLYAYH